MTEVIKVIVQSFKYKKINLRWLAHPGGMPSGHASFTSSVATLVAYLRGYDSVEFLLALSFAIIVMYDARGVRMTVGNHAKHINKLLDKHSLEEYVGHTNWEVVVGSFLGISFTILFINYWSNFL